MSATRPTSVTRLPGRKPQPLPPPPAEPLKVDFDTIPMRQLIRIEQLAGVRVSQWFGGESDGQKLAALVSVMYGIDWDVVCEESGETLSKYVEVVVPVEQDEAGEKQDDDPGNG